ncbi:polysaccharide deacetylase [Halovivax sp.]|uniref:polysaccharide deacetylase family protein n=1 Tax=Halovivax sp. TaxID=1935978 RepID=UPI0025C6435D|nr:polysaccharide deacetylase [Halovivax sp.]
MHRVCLTYDFDAVAAWLAQGRPGFASWGVYGAETAAPRLLDLHDRYEVPSTWFVPGHTAESFPEVAGRVHDDGHEIAHHGWSHEALPTLSPAEERADFVRGIDALYDLTGEKPDGFRAPDGGFSPRTVELLEEFGFGWDSSEGVRDFRPYRLRTGATLDLDAPYEPGRETGIVEVPLVWHRDDWMQLFPVVSGPEWVAYGEEPAVFERWRTDLDWMRERVDEGVFTLLLHPQCAGRAPFVAEFEAFLADVLEMDDVTFATCGEVAREFDPGA